MHCIPHLAYHACFASCCLCISRDWLWFHCLCSCCGYSRETSSWTRNLLSTLTRIKLSTTLGTSQARWQYPHNHFYLCFASCSLYRYACATYHLFTMPPILPCQASNNPFLANRCLAKLPLLLSPSYSVASCRWSWSWFHVGTWILWNITISLI